jgi:probable rRNA maturation factor
VPIELTCRAVSGRPYAGALRTDALALLRILALEHCELSLMLVSDRAIRRLNRDFRQKDQPTDVLSFPQLSTTRELALGRISATPDAPPLALGDIVISIDTARRQARELGQAAAARIRTLLIHGILHLLGYDHERSPAQARRMFAREHELAALIQTALIDNALGRQLRSQPSRAASAQARTHADQVGDSRWSPAAMPPRNLKAVKKSVVARRSS